jgi:hypothetical protein
VAPLSDEVHDRPMSLPELDVFFPQRRQFCSSESASEEFMMSRSNPEKNANR